MRAWIPLIAAVLAAPMSARAEFCGFAGLDAHVLSDPEVVLPGDGGIVVGAVRGATHGDTDVADQPTWAFRTGGVSSAPRRETLAPGLVVYRSRLDGTVALVDQDTKPRVNAFITRRARPRLAAPAIEWVVRSPDRIDVNVGLADLPPTDALAIVIVGKDGKPRSWSLVDLESTMQRVFTQRGCELQSPGTLPSSAGDEVTLFYVDAYGRRSASSKRTKIAGKTPSERRLSR